MFVQELSTFTSNKIAILRPQGMQIEFGIKMSWFKQLNQTISNDEIFVKLNKNG